MVEFARNAAFNKFQPKDSCFLELDKIYQGYLIFIAFTKTKVSPAIYDQHLPKAPLEIDVELSHVGQTSFGINTSLSLEGQSNQPLCENYIGSVFVDLATRKPSKPPDWWVEQYKQGLDVNTPPKFPRHVLPNSGFLSSYQLQIAGSNLDTYWHSNWTQYLKFSYNAFVNYATHKHGSKNVDKAFRKSKEFSLMYLQESNLKDILNVHLWKDTENTNLYKFQLIKKSDVICESQIEFYPPE